MGGATAAVGLLLILIAVAAGEGWAERHFLPVWAWSWNVQLRILLVLRMLLATLGLLVILLAPPRVARAVAAGRGRALLFQSLVVFAAAAAAFAAAEGLIRTWAWRSVQERYDLVEPRRVRDPVLGWTFLANHAGTNRIAGRLVHYVTGARGDRIPAPGREPDPTQPTLVFAGESIIMGYGLEWDETIPALVQRMSGIQAANIAVNAYGTDQILLRLQRELPRFARPVAVVVPFAPFLLDRNLDRDRPHLDPALKWHPAEPAPLRLVELARRPFRYRSAAAIRDGVAMTQSALRAAIASARARGAVPLIVVVQYVPEVPRETEIRHLVLDAGHIPYLLIRLPDTWRFPGDRHPDARGAQLMAVAITRVLEARLKDGS